jgi:hypothetical protein
MCATSSDRSQDSDHPNDLENHCENTLMLSWSPVPLIHEEGAQEMEETLGHGQWLVGHAGLWLPVLTLKHC